MNNKTRLKVFLANAVNRALGVLSLQLLPKVDAYAAQKNLFAGLARDAGEPAGSGGRSVVVFDVGASDGERTTRRYAELFENARIHAFEADEQRCRALREKKIRNVVAENLAVSDAVGETTFYCNDDADTNSLLKSNTLGSDIDKFTRFKQTVTVKTTTIDAYCAEHGIPRISILKMDIQGAELKALKGAVELLKAKKIGLVYLEVEFIRIYDNQPLYHDIAAFLEENDYHLHGLYNLCSIENKRLAWADAIFVPGRPA